MDSKEEKDEAQVIIGKETVAVGVLLSAKWQPVYGVVVRRRNNEKMKSS